MIQIVDTLTAWLQLIVLASSVITLSITVGKATQKPNRKQDDRLDALEEWRDAVNIRLARGTEHFQEIDEGNRVTLESLLALMSHAINGNDTEKLKESRDALEKYLTHRK